MKKHDEHEASLASSASALAGNGVHNDDHGESEAGVEAAAAAAALDAGLDADAAFGTAERQHLWLQQKLRPPAPSADEEEPFHCQYCPFKSRRKVPFLFIEFSFISFFFFTYVLKKKLIGGFW